MNANVKRDVLKGLYKYYLRSFACIRGSGLIKPLMNANKG